MSQKQAKDLVLGDRVYPPEGGSDIQVVRLERDLFMPTEVRVYSFQSEYKDRPLVLGPWQYVDLNDNMGRMDPWRDRT